MLDTFKVQRKGREKKARFRGNAANPTPLAEWWYPWRKRQELWRVDFSSLAYAYLRCSTSLAAHWRAGELWRKRMRWEVHDMLLRSLWLDSGNQTDLQGKGTISEPLCLEYFWVPEQLFMWRRSCFCLQSRFWLTCSEEAALHSRPEVPGISMTSPFFYWSPFDCTEAGY